MTRTIPTPDTRDREYWTRQLAIWDRHRFDARGRPHNFIAFLFEAMELADEQNFALLSIGFPLACQVFQEWTQAIFLEKPQSIPDDQRNNSEPAQVLSAEPDK